MKTFSSKKMPDRLRRHFMIYRSKISMFLDTADFDEPLMVDVSDALEMTPDNIDNADAPELFGPSRPGAEAVWVEGVVHGSVFSSRGASRIGAMIHHSTTRTSFRSQAWTGASDEFLIETFVRDSEGFARSAGPDIRFRLGTDGRVVGIEFLDEKTEMGEDARKKRFSFSNTTTRVDYTAQDPDYFLSRAVANRALFCLALMNCRNIRMRERKYGANAGPGVEGDSFHELLIGTPGMNGTVRPEATTAEGRQHLARGHFKTFTEEAPLLGRHVGTYWWSWQVRGDGLKGQISKTYKLAGRRDSE